MIELALMTVQIGAHVAALALWWSIRPRRTKAGVILLALWLGGCAVDAPEPQLYSCVVVFRCVDDAELRAALAMPCAHDVDEANERATEAGILAAGERCATAWQHVRPICEVYEPAESCELQP